MALTVAQAPAQPLLAPDAVLDYDRPADHGKVRVNLTRLVDHDVAGAFVVGFAEQAGQREDQWSMLPARPLSMIQSSGEARAARRELPCCLAVRCGPDGVWKNMSAKDIGPRRCGLRRPRARRAPDQGGSDATLGHSGR